MLRFQLALWKRTIVWENTNDRVVYKTHSHLHSANWGLLIVPRYCLSSYGRRDFSVAGHVTWNWLPDSLRDPAISRESFRRSLIHFYFQLTCVHGALELSGRCALQIYLLTYLWRCTLPCVDVWRRMSPRRHTSTCVRTECFDVQHHTRCEWGLRTTNNGGAAIKWLSLRQLLQFYIVCPRVSVLADMRNAM